MTIRLDPKRPDETRRLEHDWSAFLGTDTIASQTTTSSDVTIDASSINDDSNAVDFTVSGGTDGTLATITQTITTAAGDEETEIFRLPIRIADEPVSLTEAKAQCRMSEDDSEDSFIASLIPQARSYVEKLSTYSLMPGPREFAFSKWGDYLEIYLRPITSIDAVSYVDSDGNDADLVGYVAPLAAYPLKISPPIDDSFPALAKGGAITVSVTTDALNSESAEYLIAKRAMLLLIGHWFEFREAVVETRIAPEIAFAVTSMIDAIRPVSAY